MKRVMVRYKVKADRAAENENFIKSVFEELHQSQLKMVRILFLIVMLLKPFRRISKIVAKNYPLPRS